MGSTVGALLGDELGIGMGTVTEPPNDRYVGTSVGDTVGALLGEAEGLGVGTPTVYVGDSVGAFVGAFEGK